MFKVCINSNNRKSIFPFDTEWAAQYFATSILERARKNLEYCPAIDVINDETGEITFQISAILPCEYYDYGEWVRLETTGFELCNSCPNKDCVVRIKSSW